jgi:aspartyl/glutamyl-tRNA(Asn/Gln) amidotransferase C subunit
MKQIVQRGDQKKSIGIIFTSETVEHIAHLAQIPVTREEEKSLAEGFTSTMKVVDQLHTLDTSKITPTHQVTGKVNAFREDHIDSERMFSQAQALKNASYTYNGFIVVDQILDKD